MPIDHTFFYFNPYLTVWSYFNPFLTREVSHGQPEGGILGGGAEVGEGQDGVGGLG